MESRIHFLHADGEIDERRSGSPVVILELLRLGFRIDVGLPPLLPKFLVLLSGRTRRQSVVWVSCVFLSEEESSSRAKILQKNTHYSLVLVLVLVLVLD